MNESIELPVAEAYCCYLGRLGPAEPFQVTTWVHAVGRARVTFGNRITADGGREVAVGYTMHACTNSEGRPLGLTPELAERLAPGS